jgi:two-component system, chemotaxis family, chemotaxis protein CheY
VNKTIMTVDDSATARLVVSITLKKAGFEVLEAVDGRDALAKMNGSPVHMMLTDLNMPDMDGIELIRHVRANPSCRFIPIVIAAGGFHADEKEAGKAAGVTGWIKKPFKPEELLALVKKVLR